jgi:uncharacterized repeat protein (TIGR03837 family)
VAFPETPNLRCDLSCRVIDNFGDAGVCWRLARELCVRQGWQVRLIIDRPELIARLAPGFSNSAGWPEVVSWEHSLELGDIPDIVIEAFGCFLPEPYLDRMRQRTPAPVWINLEYLSAEAWIDDCHGLPSPDPKSGIAKYFFFPGFSARSGGLIREDAVDQVAATMSQADLRSDWLRSIGVDCGVESSLVSLFCYDDSPVEALFADCARDANGVHFLVPAGLPQENLQQIFGRATFYGIRATVLPFLAQDDYDRLLACCDVNFVRGEDSFVRAQWAGKPFVWQAYRQAENAHHLKLTAFLDRYLDDLRAPLVATLSAAHRAWNGVDDWPPGLWAKIMGHRAAIRRHNAQWVKLLAGNGNLAENLAVFCRAKL